MVGSSLVSAMTSTVHDKGVYTKRIDSCSRSRTPSISHNAKPTMKVVIEKKKVINKLLPPNSSTNKTSVIKRFRSNGIISQKQFTNTSINTQVTGSLKCDNNCLTVVRKRNYGSCRCSHKSGSINMDFKETQASGHKYQFTDKACFQNVETVNRGTQFLERLSGVIKNSTNRMNAKSSSKFVPKHERKSTPLISNVYKRLQPLNNRDCPLNLQYFGARRWTLPNSDRKPDF